VNQPRDLLDGIGHHECCQTDSSSEKGSKIVLPTDKDSWVCLSGTAYQGHHDHPGKLCDLILFWLRDEGISVAPIELKSGGFSPSSVLEQLQAGAVVADSLLPEGIGFFFAPVLVHQRIGTIEIRQLAKRRINFRGRLRLVQSERSVFDATNIDWG
jgi:hypothetical protein